MRQRVIINLKPIIERLDAQGEIFCSLQSDVNSIFMSQASTSKELSQVKNAVRWFNKELGSMKTMLSEILKAVGAQAPPPPPPADQRSEEGVPRPSGPDEQVAGPSGPATASPQAEVSGSGPSGPDEQVSRPSGQAEHITEEAEAVAPGPPAPSSTQTPIPSSPPSSSTAPPAPQTFKKPQPRTISSPTPFPSQSTSSPASSTPISPPPPIFEVPPVSSSVGASSSSDPPSSGPSDIPPTTSHSLLHPSPPPSFITVIPEGAQLESPYLGKIKDEFEEVILRSVLKVGDHIHRAIDALGSADAHTEAIQVDFATLQVPEEILLPPIHSLVMDSSVGSIIFEHFARVMGRIKVQQGFQVAFHRFLFREYHQGHVSAKVLAPILSKCERLTPSDWARFYPLSAQQLSVLNECQAREGHPPVSEATFLDMNSIHLVQDPFQILVERYKVYVALCQELKANQNFYPISVDQFLARASFGLISFKRISLDREAYANFLDEQLALHLKRMTPSMGPKYTLAPGVFRQVFEKQEEQAWEIISHFASLLSPAFYLLVPSQNE
ncbi:hypothetical protein Taro_001572 [Colocasia esculenta]|uniref:Uncharacterized protein n=1 Tax=Colocasia esculenta TaxID=4460 RepID=A0A843TE12_COLES|nr:hypothetical protein [Colocasia esculenta]